MCELVLVCKQEISQTDHLAIFFFLILELVPLPGGQEWRRQPVYPGVTGQRVKACGLVCVSAQNRGEIIGFLF